MECIKSVKRLNPFEIILVDDCSTDKEIVDIAKKSGFIYIKTPYNSGTDSLPFNMGVIKAKGDYICRVDSDDLLLSLPDYIPYDIYFGNINRVKAPLNITIEDLILAPRAIMSSSTIKKELWLKYPYFEGSKIYTDVLCALRMLYNNHSFSVSPKINYIYRKRKSSIQSSKSNFTHRLTHIQTISQFCIDENIPPKESIKYIQLAVMNLKYGSKSRNFLKK
jgi:glycosyltransferase involved in cell wall biosynthesis